MGYPNIDGGVNMELTHGRSHWLVLTPSADISNCNSVKNVGPTVSQLKPGGNFGVITHSLTPSLPNNEQGELTTS